MMTAMMTMMCDHEYDDDDDNNDIHEYDDDNNNDIQVSCVSYRVDL